MLLKDRVQVGASHLVCGVKAFPLLYRSFGVVAFDFRVSPSRMICEVDERGKAGKLSHSPAQLGLRSNPDKRQQPGHDGSYPSRNGIDPEDRKIGRRLSQPALIASCL